MGSKRFDSVNITVSFGCSKPCFVFSWTLLFNTYPLMLLFISLCGEDTHRTKSLFSQTILSTTRKQFILGNQFLELSSVVEKEADQKHLPTCLVCLFFIGLLQFLSNFHYSWCVISVHARSINVYIKHASASARRLI